MQLAKQRGLGKGLDALFLDNNTEDGAITSLKLSEIEPNPGQPRQEFDEEALTDLADSIRVHGVIQPLVVRPLEKGGYGIVAGERRWRASRRAGLSEVPVVIRDLTEEETLEIAIIENLQREDLNVVELAQGYQALMQQYHMTQEEVAKRVGKSRSAVANTVRLLGLPKPVLERVAAGEISQGHAKALLSLEEADLISEIAERIVKEGILVRDVEKLARQLRTVNPKQQEKVAAQSESAWGESYFREMELALSEELGQKVNISSRGNRHILMIEFYHREELEELAAKLSGEKG